MKMHSCMTAPPGSMLTTANPSRNRSRVSQPRLSCSSAWMMPMMAGPPKLVAPSLRKVFASSSHRALKSSPCVIASASLVRRQFYTGDSDASKRSRQRAGGRLSVIPGYLAAWGHQAPFILQAFGVHVPLPRARPKDAAVRAISDSPSIYISPPELADVLVSTVAGHDAFPVHLIVLPLANVLETIGKRVRPLSVQRAIAVFAFKHLAIGTKKSGLAVGNSILEIANKLVAIGINRGSLPVRFSLLPLTGMLAPVRPDELSDAV